MHYDNQFSKGFEIETQKQINITILKLMDEFDKIVLQRDELTQQRDELTQQRDELTQQRDELTQQRDELTQQRDEIAHDLALTREARDNLINSTIWKVTKPIRWTVNLFKE
jgi:uncharacterized coiled-coil DUF342 family protein